MKTVVQLYKEGNKWIMSSDINSSMRVVFNSKESAYRTAKTWRFTIKRATHRDKKYMKANQINVIKPYKYHGQWVFDDPSVDLEREAFVAGADTLLDMLTHKIPDAEDGVLVLFSGSPFPDYQVHLHWDCEEMGGNVYQTIGDKQVGSHELWLCPALLKYYQQAPKDIYLQVKPVGGEPLPEDW
tara:strand:- start:14084 stop:14635 length:552 start_codon:yes stop_codon:yes gene_type:complete